MTNAKELVAQLGPSEAFNRARAVARRYVEDLKAKGEIYFSEFLNGRKNFHISRRTVPEVWEDMMMALLGFGMEYRTHYDPKNEKGEYTSFPSLEATGIMDIEQPAGEPRFHKHFLGGWKGFGDYKAEIEGVKDPWMIQPEAVAEKMRQGKFAEIKGDERWNYTYNQRFRAYPYFDLNGKLHTIDQLKQVVKNLKKDPSSRSAQCITWDPRWDHNTGEIKSADGSPAVWKAYHSPCLQRFWFRLAPTEKGYRMDVNGHWRSRDHLKAVPQNIFGVVEGMHEQVRLELQNELGVEIARGSYTDISDSLHLYGHYFDTAKQGLDAEAYLQDVFRIADGEPIENRLILPGTDMHDVMMEEIKTEYDLRKANPMFGSNM